MRKFHLLIFFIFFLFPIAFLLVTSFKSPDQAMMGSFFPTKPVMDNWFSTFEKIPLLAFLRNSIVSAISSSLLTLAITVPAVYAVEKLHVAQKWLPNFILGVYLAPPVVALLPLFFMLRFAGLIDSLSGMILVFGLMNIPVAFWLLRPFMVSIPRELDEASWVDGASFWRTFLRINLPLLAPALIATGLICTILAYNELLFASTFTFSDTARTLTVGVSLFQGDRLVNFGQMAVASLTAIIPVYFIALIFQRWLIGGLTAGSVK